MRKIEKRRQLNQLEAQLRAQVALAGWVVQTNRHWPTIELTGCWFDIAQPNGFCVFNCAAVPTREEALNAAASFLRNLE